MEPVKDHQGMKIIGIDNGYGNIKTANCCFPAGLTVHGAEPVFKDDLLVYDGRYEYLCEQALRRGVRK